MSAAKPSGQEEDPEHPAGQVSGGGVRPCRYVGDSRALGSAPAWAAYQRPVLDGSSMDESAGTQHAPATRARGGDGA